MRILWHRVVAVLLTVLAAIILITNWIEIIAFLGTSKAVGSVYYTPEERTKGLMAFGLVVISILAVVKILLSRRDE